jgi:hypothetical protein
MSANYAINYVDGVYVVLPATFTPSLFDAPLAQRELRLGAVTGSGAASCLRRELDGWSAAHWLSAPFGTVPACLPDRAAPGTR